MKLSILIEQFLITKSQSVKSGTLDNYREHFYNFQRYCESRTIFDTEMVTDKVFSEYLLHIQKTCKNRTINIRFGNLQRIYRDMGLRSEFLETYKKRKEQYTTFDMVDFSTLKAIREYLYFLPKTNQNLFHAGLLLVLMETGCRRSELIHIETRNVNLQQREIKLTTTKTDEDRFVYFSERTKPIIAHLMKFKKDHKFLFHNPDKNRAISFYDLRYVLLKIKDVFKLDKIHAHMFRHSFVTKLSEEKIPDIVIMAMTGHKNADTFKRYNHIRKYKIKQMYDEGLKLD